MNNINIDLLRWKNINLVQKLYILIFIFHRQVTLIHDLQIELNEMNAMVKVLPHLARPCDRIAKEVLAFVCLSLFNANEEVM